MSVDSTLIDSTHNGMQHISTDYDEPLPHLIHDNSLYIVNNTMVVDKGIEGGLIEKLDLQTGEKLWANYYDLRNNNRREYAECMYLNSQGNLNVVTDRRINTNHNGGAGWGDTSLLCIREYDIDSGELLQQNFPDTTDYSSKRIRASNLNRTILYPLKDDKFMYVEYNKHKYIRDLLDRDGHLIAETVEDSVVFDKYYNPDSVRWSFKYMMKKVNEDTMVALNYLSKVDKNFRFIYKGFDRQTKLTLYDNNLNEIKVFKIGSFIPLRSRKILLDADSKFIYVRGIQKSLISLDTFSYSIFNFDGELVRKFIPMYENMIIRIDFTYLEKEKEFLAVSLSRDKNRLRFFMTNPEGTLDLIKELKLVDNYRTFTTDYLEQLDNGDILLYGLNRLDSVKFTDQRRWHTWMRIKAEDIGILGETDIQNISFSKTIKLFPNPTIDKLNLDFQSDFTGDILVIDELGRVVVSEKRSGVKNIVLDVSKIEKGLYFVRAISDKEVYKVEVFVKE